LFFYNFTLTEVAVSHGKIAIIGIGEVPTRIMPERTRWDILYDVCMDAIRDSGLHKSDIEGVITTAPQAQAVIASELFFGKLPEELGLKGCWTTFSTVLEPVSCWGRFTTTFT
jgi:acetyl-CoA C-acetyltransferase